MSIPVIERIKYPILSIPVIDRIKYSKYIEYVKEKKISNGYWVSTYIREENIQLILSIHIQKRIKYPMDIEYPHITKRRKYPMDIEYPHI